VFRRRRERQVHVGDAGYDDWAVVRDFEDVESALAWRDHLRATGIKAVLTSDWPLDEFRRGDIALRVEPSDYGDAEAFLSGFEDDTAG
jgi:hypothetical protein